MQCVSKERVENRKRVHHLSTIRKNQNIRKMKSAEVGSKHAGTIESEKGTVFVTQHRSTSTERILRERVMNDQETEKNTLKSSCFM